MTTTCGSGCLPITGTPSLPGIMTTVVSAGMVAVPPEGRPECAGTRSPDTSSAALLPSSTVSTAGTVAGGSDRSRSVTGSIVPGRTGHVCMSCMSISSSCDCEHTCVVKPTGALLPITTACYSALNSGLASATNIASGATGVANSEILSSPSGSGTKVFDILSGMSSNVG